MSQITVGSQGELTLPEAVRSRYGIEANTKVRVIETRDGVMLIPLTDAPMSPELAQELAEWQALGALSLEAFPYEDTDA